MKKTVKYVAAALIVLVTAAISVSVFAGRSCANGDSTDAGETEETDPAGKKDGKAVSDKTWKLEKKLVEQRKKELEAQKDQLEYQKTAVEAQYAEALADGDQVRMDELNKKIWEFKKEICLINTEMHAKIKEMQAIMRKRYTHEEKEQLASAAEKFSEMGIKALPVENILVKNRDIKFDTPPVIHEGRILIPVRAISEAMGALVSWDQEKRTVTVDNGKNVIVFDIDGGKTVVNGTEMQIDVSAQVMNHRTMVPMRFIAEKLGLKVVWDPDTETAEIEPEDGEPQGEKGLGGAEAAIDQ